MLLAVLAAPAASTAASPGGAGIGDRLFPTLGNGGYDVLNYQLNLRYATSDPSQPVHGDVVILARATQSLSRFNLDFGGASVGSVSVNYRQAAWTRDGEELVITPQQALPDHRLFVVVVSDFVAVPTEPDPSDFSTTAFFITPDGSATAPQPDFAHLIFPVQRPSARQGALQLPDRRPGRPWQSPTAWSGRSGRTAIARPGRTSSASRWRRSCCRWPWASTT